MELGDQPPSSRVGSKLKVGLTPARPISLLVVLDEENNPDRRVQKQAASVLRDGVC
ncbi:MAG: hypothetical protein ACLSAF_09260 [Intestinimonas sp.]